MYTNTDINALLSNTINDSRVAFTVTMTIAKQQRVVCVIPRKEACFNTLKLDLETMGYRTVFHNNAIAIPDLVPPAPLHIDNSVVPKWVSHDEWVDSQLSSEGSIALTHGAIISWLQDVLPPIHPHIYQLSQRQVDDIALALIKYHKRSPIEIESLLNVIFMSFNVEKSKDVVLSNSDYWDMLLVA